MKKFANIYIGMLVLYYAQGAFYTEGSFLSRTLFVLILLVSVYYFFYANSRYILPKPLKIMSFLLLVFTIYGLVPILVGVGDISRDISSFQFIKMIYLSQLPIYVFYVFWREDWINESVIRIWYVAFVLVAIAGFYYSNSQMLINAQLVGSSAEEFTNNEGYTVLSLICLLPLFNRKPILQFAFLGVIMAYVLMGYKRGAMIAGVLCILWFFYQSFRIDKMSGTKLSGRNIFRIFLVAALVIVAVYGVQYLFDTSDYFNSRLERTIDGDSSGRDSMYESLFYHFINENNLFKFLFGNGAYGTAIIYGNGAHNDWLEIAIDNGFVFLVVYLAYWISMFKLLFKGDKYSMATTMLGLFVILYFMKTLYSMSYNTVTPYAACALAYALVNYKRNVKIHKS